MARRAQPSKGPIRPAQRASQDLLGHQRNRSVRDQAVTDRPENAKEFYDEVWRKYAHLDAKSPAAVHRRRLVVELARRAKPDAPRVLHVCCGQGELFDAI